jgi:hypothetical protein
MQRPTANRKFQKYRIPQRKNPQRNAPAAMRAPAPAPPAPSFRSSLAAEAQPPEVASARPTAKPAVSGSAIHNLILSRPGALQSIFALSEVIRPPLALRTRDDL